MKRAIRLLVCGSLVVLGGCSEEDLTRKEQAAIVIAERFVRRHGFTTAGHPVDMPVVGTDINDALLTSEQLVSVRKGSLNQRAVGVARTGVFSPYYVLFDGPNSVNGQERQPFFVVSVEGKDASRVHQMMIFTKWKKNERQ